MDPWKIAQIGLWALFSSSTSLSTEEEYTEQFDKLYDKAWREQSALDVVSDVYAASLKSRGEDNMKIPLEEKVDKLALICRAMWEVLRDKHDLSDELLLNKVKEIDLSDGSLDGKVRIPPRKCSKCGRVVSKKHLRCMYCGSQELEDSPFNSM